MTDEPQIARNFVELSEAGARICLTLTRGTDTRDQDRIHMEVNGADIADARSKADDAVATLEELFTATRAIQPDEETEGPK